MEMSLALGQVWPHLCGGRKKCPKKFGGHNNLLENAWRAKLDLRRP